MKFKDYFKHVVKEDNTAGGGTVFGPGSVLPPTSTDMQGDFYATGDARVPKVLGVYSRRGRIGKKKYKRKTR